MGAARAGQVSTVLPGGRPAALGIDPQPASRATREAGLARPHRGRAPEAELTEGGWGAGRPLRVWAACVWRSSSADKEPPRGTHVLARDLRRVVRRALRLCFIHHGLGTTLVV